MDYAFHFIHLLQYHLDRPIMANTFDLTIWRIIPYSIAIDPYHINQCYLLRLALVDYFHFSYSFHFLCLTLLLSHQLGAYNCKRHLKRAFHLNSNYFGPNTIDSNNRDNPTHCFGNCHYHYSIACFVNYYLRQLLQRNTSTSYQTYFSFNYSILSLYLIRFQVG